MEYIASVPLAPRPGRRTAGGPAESQLGQRAQGRVAAFAGRTRTEPQRSVSSLARCSPCRRAPRATWVHAVVDPPEGIAATPARVRALFPLVEETGHVRTHRTIATGISERRASREWPSFRRVRGRKRDLALLLHGFPDDARSMLLLAERFVAAGFRSIAPYLRGYRPSDAAPDGDYGIVSLARDAVGLIDAANAETATIVGHDWGAVTAYVAANLSSARVRRIVTMSVPPPRIFFPSFLRHPAQIRRSWYMGYFQLPGAAAPSRGRRFRVRRPALARLEPRLGFPGRVPRRGQGDARRRGRREPRDRLLSIDSALPPRPGRERSRDVADRVRAHFHSGPRVLGRSRRMHRERGLLRHRGRVQELGTIRDSPRRGSLPPARGDGSRRRSRDPVRPLVTSEWVRATDTFRAALRARRRGDRPRRDRGEKRQAGGRIRRSARSVRARSAPARRSPPS